MAVILENVPLLEGYTMSDIKRIEDKLTGTFPQVASLLPKMFKDLFVGGQEDMKMTKVIQAFEKPVPVQVNMYTDMNPEAFSTPFIYGKMGILLANFPLTMVLVFGRMILTWGFKFRISNGKILCVNVPNKMRFNIYYSAALRPVLEDDERLLTAILLQRLAGVLTISSFLRLPTMAVFGGGAMLTTQPTSSLGTNVSLKMILQAGIGAAVLASMLVIRYIHTPTADEVVKELGYGEELATALARIQTYVPPSAHVWFKAVRAIDVIIRTLVEYANRIIPILDKPSNMVREANLTNSPITNKFWKLTTLLDRTAASLMTKILNYMQNH